jgi:hypothetical protein
MNTATALVTVKFLRSYGAYGEGEVAGFSAEHAAFLVKRGIAEKIVVAKKEGDVGGQKTVDPGAPQNRQSTGTASSTPRQGGSGAVNK